MVFETSASHELVHEAPGRYADAKELYDTWVDDLGYDVYLVVEVLLANLGGRGGAVDGLLSIRIPLSSKFKTCRPLPGSWKPALMQIARPSGLLTSMEFSAANPMCPRKLGGLADTGGD